MPFGRIVTHSFKALLTRLRTDAQAGVDVPIFCYHQIGQEEETRFPSIYLSRRDFERQIAWLAGRGYTFLSLSDLTQLIQQDLQPSGKCCILTFDDGYEGVYQHAFPILQKYHCRATV